MSKAAKSKTTSNLISAVTSFTNREKNAVAHETALVSPVQIEAPIMPKPERLPSIARTANDEPENFTIYVSKEESNALERHQYDLKLKYGVKKHCNRSSLTRFWLTKIKVTPEFAEEFRQFLEQQKAVRAQR